MLNLSITANGFKAPYEFGKIVIYGNGVKLFERDDLQAYEKRVQSNGAEWLTEVYRGGPVAITLAGEIKRAVKENLNRKDNYILSYPVEYFPRERRQALYIHESEIEVDDLGEMLSMETGDTKYFLHGVRLRFVHPFAVERANIEKIPCLGDWKIPDGGRWGDGFGTVEHPQYSIWEKGPGVIKRWFSTEQRKNGGEMLSAFRTYCRIEHSQEYERRERIAEKLKAAGLRNFSQYDVDTLEKALGVKLEG